MRNHLSIFFISLAAFAMLVFLSPVISTLLLGMQLQVVFTAPLAAIALVSGIFYYLSRSQVQIPKSCINFLLILFPISILASFWGFSWIQNLYDQEVFDHVLKPGVFYIEQLIENQVSIRFACLTMAIIAFPYTIYAAILNLFFYHSPKLISSYKFEMLGALIGSILILPILEIFGFKGSLVLITFAASAPCFYLSRLHKIFGVLPSLFLIFLAGKFEPQRDLHLVARDFGRNANVSLLAEGWNIFSKVQTIKLSGPAGSYKIVAIGDGTGIAKIREIYPPRPVENIFARIQKALHPKAKSTAILFAGAGADMVDLHRAYGNGLKMTGVEINQKLVQQAFENMNEATKDILVNNGNKILNMDARNFLRLSKENFDSIIYSWSGATIAHYSGALMHTTQYAFTKEALQEAYDRLSPNGILVIAGGSKVNLILNLKELFRDATLENLDSSLILLSPPTTAPEDLYRNWDNVILVLKKGRFNGLEVQSLKNEFQSTLGYKVVQSPNEPGVGVFSKFKELVVKDDVRGLLTKLTEEYGTYFGVFKDDRPFVYNSLDPSVLGTLAFWRNTLQNMFTIGLISNAWILILGLSFTTCIYLLSTIEKSSLNPRLTLASYFCGFTSSSLTIYCIYLLLFYISQPTYVLILGLGFGFISSYIFSALNISANLYKILSQVLMILSGVSICASLFFDSLALLPIYIFTLICFGFFFPALVRQSKSKKSFFFVFSTDNLGALMATALVPLLIENFGFSAVGVVIMTVILLTVSTGLSVKSKNA